jgi:hypothetical protein
VKTQPGAYEGFWVAGILYEVIDWVNNPQFRATKRHKKNFTKNSFVICFVPFCGYTNLKGDSLGLAESQQTALF